MTDKLTAQTTAVGAFLLALANLLASFGVILPAYATGPAIALINAAALGVAGAVAGIKHIIEKSNAPA